MYFSLFPSQKVDDKPTVFLRADRLWTPAQGSLLSQATQDRGLGTEHRVAPPGPEPGAMGWRALGEERSISSLVATVEPLCFKVW